jgi:hypothetical protein
VPETEYICPRLAGICRAHQVVMVAGNGQHGLAVHFRVIEAGEQRHTSGAGGGQTDAQFAGVLGIGTSHKGRRLFVAHLNETDLILAGAQSLHNAVDTVAGQAEDYFDPQSWMVSIKMSAAVFAIESPPSLDLLRLGSKPLGLPQMRRHRERSNL